MTVSPPRNVLAARGPFWAQVGLGVLAGLGAAVGLVAVVASGPMAPVAVLFVVAWLGAALAGLLALERRKIMPVTARTPEEWAQHVRQLRASRREIVDAFEIERHRIERDLHDGAQQYLVATSLKVGEAALILETSHSGALEQVSQLLAQAQDSAETALAALRATVAGIHPAVLSDLGLEAAVRELAARSPADVRVRVPHRLPELPEAVAAAAYFLIAEALTNVVKHAPLARTSVLLSVDETLHVSVVDDGPGGARIRPGHGLAGLAERLAAFGGELTVTSPQGGPTTLVARVPLLLEDGRPGVVLEMIPGEVDR